MYISGHNINDYVLRMEDTDGRTAEYVFHAGDYGNIAEMVRAVVETAIRDSEIELDGFTKVDFERV